jgi:hypothetical protein
MNRSRQAWRMNRHREEVRAKWRELLSEQEQSGESAAAFCRGRALCTRQFYYWKKQSQRGASPQFMEVQLVRSHSRETHFRSALASPIEVRLGNGRSLVVGPDFDASHLRALLAVVESA